MKFTAKQKERLKRELISCLVSEKEIKKIIVFGSFLHSNNPNDIDVAIFQDSTYSAFLKNVILRELATEESRLSIQFSVVIRDSFNE